MPNPSLFQDFTNLYSLSKTLKFELIPTEITKSHLNFEKDRSRASHYQNIKLLFDQLHREFINEGLVLFANSGTDYNEFFRIYTQFLQLRKVKKDKKSEFETIRKAFEDIKLKLREKIVEYFGICGENFKGEYNEIFKQRWVLNGKDVSKFKPVLKANGIKVLTEAGILQVLVYLVEIGELEIQDKTKEEIIEGIKFFDRFFTYFGPFNDTRENLYKSDGTSTAIATRIIDENLVRFCDNIILLNNDIKLKDNLTIKPIDIDLNYNRGIFDINSFNNFVTQDGIDNYNGGEQGDTNLAQFNTLFSKYIRDTFGQNKKLITKNLYKIMLSEKVSVFAEETGESCIEILKNVDQLQNLYLPSIEANYQMIWDNQNNDELLEKVFIKKENLAILSNKFFGAWYILEKAIAYVGGGEIKTERGEQKIKLDSFVPLVSIKKALEALADGVDFEIKSKSKSKSKKQLQDNETMLGYKAGELFRENLITGNQKESTNLWEIFVHVWQIEFNKQVEANKKFNEVAKQYLLGLDEYSPQAETEFELTIEDKGEEKKVIQTQSNIAKLWLDSCMELWHNIKMFELIKKNESKYSEYIIDDGFYKLVQNFSILYPLSKNYDKIRNFSTKKPFSTNKFKINFENAKLLAGWDVNKESDNTSVILKNGDKYELIIMDKKFNSYFDKTKNPELYKNPNILKMEYKLLTDVSKSIPKCTTQTKNVINHFKNSDKDYTLVNKSFSKPLVISKEEFELNNRIYQKTDISISYIRDKKSDIDEKQYVKVIQKGFVDFGGDDEVYKASLIQWINFCKRFVNSYKSCNYFDFSELKDSTDYNSLDEFYKDVDLKCYKIKWVGIDNSILEKDEKQGKIFRFKIKNKDWNLLSKGKPNLQTIFWNQLFSADNLANPCYKLNGEAEIFQRPSSIKKILKKPNCDTIIHKRFTDNKTFLHIPITINFGAKEITKSNDYIKKNLDQDNINYLGIDRGENHLLYYSLINSKGEILDQGSLNTFDGVDYEKKLRAKQEERKDAKDKWAVIGNIKELKAGYLSLAIGKIIRLAINNNALIVLENLNYGFKKSRTIKFEKSVYQKFEVALATKLQYVVLKEKQPNELGGALNGLQLCPPLEITKLDKVNDWGIIKYVGASYTSRICPLTDWHKTWYLKTVEDAKKAFNPDEDNCILIQYSSELKCYTFCYKKDNDKEFIVYAHKELVRNYYDQKETQYENRLKTINGEEINIRLDELLKRYKINDEFDQNSMLSTFDDKNWKELAYLFDLICNIRVKQTINGEKIDRIQSPIGYNHNGEIVFFDTQNIEELQTKLGTTLPIDGDANGAYNIAKKALKINKI